MHTFTVYENRETIQTAAETVQQEKESGFLDHIYLPHKGIHGILKVIQCVRKIFTYLLRNILFCNYNFHI